MSFFDEADEPRTAPRTAPRRRRPAGSGRRPPTDRQAIQARRAVAAGVVVVVLVLMVIGIHSCQVSARDSALKDYNANVASLNRQSTQNGSSFFQLLAGGGGAGNATHLQEQVASASQTAQTQLSHTRGLDVPDEVRPAQQNFLLTMQLRADGLANIARWLGQALGSTTKRDAVSHIATEMARFYASDVVYKWYTVPLVIGALRKAGIAVTGANAPQTDSSQFLPDLQWLTPTFVASKLGVSLPAATGKITPGLHGHSLDSVSVAGTTLQTGSTNTISASPPPTFSLRFTNTGQNTETGVICKVTISGSSVSGQTTVPQTTAGQQSTCQVPLSTSPAKGSSTVTATIVPVPGEKNVANNTMSFPVTFQ